MTRWMTSINNAIIGVVKAFVYLFLMIIFTVSIMFLLAAYKSCYHIIAIY